MENIVLARPIIWRYDAPEMIATCLVYGDALPVRVSLHSSSTGEVPDVVLVDEELRARLASAPTTVEGLAVEIAERWGFDVTVVGGPTERHGIITATASSK